MTDQIIGYDDGDVDTNRSANPHLADIVVERFSRRSFLSGGVGAASVFFAGSLVSACGDDDRPRIDSGPPTATATASSASVRGGALVTLTGTASDDGTVTSRVWTQTAGPVVTLDNAATLTPSFIAPAVATATPLTFRLTVQDDAAKQTTADTTVTVQPAALGFTAVPRSLADTVAVPAGYSVGVLYRLGDPLNAATPAYANNGTDTGFSARAGDHHDGMSYFGLAATGSTPDRNNSSRGLLVMNHENITVTYLHPAGPTIANGVRPTAEVVKEIEAHGVSVVEVTRAANGGWSYVQNSALNRRVTPFTPTVFNGPVRGNPLLFTAYSPTGTAGRGTINNCANGLMPWGTYATCEENWAGYFRREAGDATRRAAALGTRAQVAFARYGLGTADTLRAGNYNWATAAATASGNTDIAKFNATTVATAPANGTGDFRNEPNQYGWVVEIDPYDPGSVPRKRTALGRMNHEGAWPGRTIAGVRPAWYMGDDAQNEYVYKFVSATPWAAADAVPADRLATGDKYLDTGTLYVARFNADGSGVWLPLVFGQNGLTAGNSVYAFADQADVLTHCRLAADIVGATRMDRPEWTAINPVTGEMYCTLTNNSSRTVANTDAANPRAYTDFKAPQGDLINNDPGTATSRTSGNANGHIIRLRETGDTTEATGFTWDVYAFGAGADLDPTNINLSGLDATNDFSSPDGLWFGRSTNPSGQVNPLLWIQTDDGAYTDITNCMMLAAMPGSVGDGGTRTITNRITATNGTVTTGTQTARVGRQPGTSLRRFLVGPVQCEITGIDSTPDGRSLFVNIQHPGEDGSVAAPTSAWPANQMGTAPAGTRPRSATIVITRNDGGVVGL
ncbi:MAG: DUF839 domain-containing protein [Sphingomonas fennica]